jgi:hypothetical protein
VPSSHREDFARMVQELTVLLDEIATRRVNRDLGKVLTFFDQSVGLFGVKEWPALVASGNGDITRWHVESAQMMLELAGRAATILREPTPPQPH